MRSHSRRHALGQHFLVNRSVLARIADAAGAGPGDVVVEIGAGRGQLTRLLAERAGRVVAIEKDERLLPDLRASVPANVEVVAADVLSVDLASLAGEAAKRGEARLAGNLPYAISTPILARVLDARRAFVSAVFLLQKEVAERVVAGPGTKAYAPLGILLQDAFAARIEFLVSPGSFSPPPKVDSALLSLRRRPAPLLAVGDAAGFGDFLRAAFAERRKMMRKNLAAALGAAPDRLDRAFAETGIDPRARAEQVSMDRLAALFERLARE